VDQVLVSSVTRSRVPELKVAFVIGAVEGKFPKVVEEDPILSDAQREIMNRETKFAVGASSDRQLLEMPFFDYVALTRASERLVITYPLAERSGKAVVKSRYIGRVRELVAGGEGLVERKLDAASRTDVEHIGTMDDLLTGVVVWAREVIRRRMETLGGFSNFDFQLSNGDDRAALYDWLVRAPEAVTRGAVKAVWGCIEGKGAPRLAGELARQFYPPEKPLRLSVSQLEKFAGCPLQYFMHYTLGLRPRAMLELDTLHLGVLFHRILEKIYLEIIGGRLEWPDCDAASLRKVLEREVDAACEELHQELAERMPAYEQMKARTKRTLGIVLEGQRRRACQGDMRPTGVEVKFEKEGQEADAGAVGARTISLPMLTLMPPGGHVVELNGKIDRVDASAEGKGKMVAVIDYKSSSKKTLELYWVFHGLALQLAVYAVVMEELAGKEPVAAMYVPLGIKRETVKRPSADSPLPGPDSDAFYQALVPRGVFDESGAAHFDHAIAPHEDAGASSNWYEIGYKKDGGIPKRGDMISHEDFRTVLAFVRWKIGTMTDELMAGEIVPKPYRDKKQIPCDECDFLSLCPFDKVSGSFRAVPKMKREEAIAAMRSAMGT
jgi:ATP-dependent helicase/nuclease subunit B